MASKNFVVGIPTYNRYDLLKMCVSAVLAGDAVPHQVLIVDNGGNLRMEYLEDAIHDRVRFVTPGWNTGCAAAWNMVHRVYAPMDIVYLNDDVIVGRETLSRLLASTEPIALSSMGFSAFIIRQACWDVVGEFDAEFRPAYYEDNDYYHRCEICGVPVGRVKTDDCGDVHHGSASGGNSGITRGRYLAKWGGLPGGETVRVPYPGETPESTIQRLAKERSAVQ